jgi:uncharacterized glyoxalase superfamily protein PhnB
MPELQSMTPLLYVERIEPLLPFYLERLGFTAIAEVPEGDALGFVILEKDGMQLMLQSRASVAADLPALADVVAMNGTILFIRVASIDAVERALAGVEPLVPRRTTFYGATEIFVRDPAGNVLGFAEFAAPAE